MISRTKLRVASLLTLTAGFYLAACSDPDANSPAGSGGTGGPSGSGGVVGGGGAGTGGISIGSGGIGSGGIGIPSGGTGTGANGGGGVPGGGGSDTGGGGGDGSGGSVPSGVAVMMDATHQTIQGFGINTALMPSTKTIPVAKLFGTNMNESDEIGLSILRIGMDSTGALTGVNVADVKNIPGTKIIGSTWTPPAECKEWLASGAVQDGNLLHGGRVKPSCYEQWATTIANFAKAQNLYAMSIANESDFQSCAGVPVCTVNYDTAVYTAKEMVEWVKVAGKKIREVSPNTKVIAPEASEWIHAWSNLSGTGSLVASHPHSSDPLECGCYGNEITAEAEATCAQKCKDGDGYDYGHKLWDDQDAWKSFDIFGVHEYDSQIAYAWPDDVNLGVKDKEIWQTEMSGVMYWPEQGPTIDINNGVAVAGWIHSALTIGEASAWLYWWYEAYYDSNDNEGLGLVQGNSTIAKRYYALGNYSKFVLPGYVAVEVIGNSNTDLLLSAYKSPEGKVVIVAVNKSATAVTVPITIAGGAAPATMMPWVTSATENLKNTGTAVPVTGGVVMAALSAKSVTTFVSQ